MSRAPVQATSLMVTVIIMAISARGVAQPCSSKQPESGAPLRVPLGPGGLGSLPEACAATELSVQGFASVLVAERDFYGMLDAGGGPHLRVALPSGAWISATLPPIEYRFVANATIEADSTGFGAGAIGAHFPVPVSGRLELAPFARVLMPTETIYERATRYGLDHGISAVYRADDTLEIIGGVVFPLLLTINDPAVYPVYMPSASVDVAFEPWRFLSLLVGAGARVHAGADRSLESLDLRSGLRLHLGGGSRIELAAVFPVRGADRTNVFVAAMFGWLWPRRPPERPE